MEVDSGCGAAMRRRILSVAMVLAVATELTRALEYADTASLATLAILGILEIVSGNLTAAT